MTDRRSHRSSHYHIALRYQLENTMRRGRMAALALTDHSGLLVAWAGEDALCEELGAVAPMVVHGWPPNLERAAIAQQEVSVHSIECFGEQLFLASLGGGVARSALLAHSARGIHRILTAN
jgi:hypothetical protein